MRCFLPVCLAVPLEKVSALGTRYLKCPRAIKSFTGKNMAFPNQIETQQIQQRYKARLVPLFEWIRAVWDSGGASSPSKVFKALSQVSRLAWVSSTSWVTGPFLSTSRYGEEPMPQWALLVGKHLGVLPFQQTKRRSAVPELANPNYLISEEMYQCNIKNASCSRKRCHNVASKACHVLGRDVPT